MLFGSVVDGGGAYSRKQRGFGLLTLKGGS